MNERRFNTKDVADYYDQTLVHYKQWWKLKESMSLHYGMWFPNTANFKEALLNTNRVMAEKAGIQPGSKVLDAGCGVGGAAVYLASELNCEVNGVTLSPKQVEFAKNSISALNLNDRIAIEVQDYTNTSFADNSFDYAWACESSSSAVDKADFAKEMFRILKPGGKLVLTDFFWPEANMEDPRQYMKKWGDTWGISDFDEVETFNKHLIESDFTIDSCEDYTTEVTPAAKRMYRAYRIGSPGSRLYNLIYGKKVSRFARSHFLCGKYQYLALKNGLWKYYLIVASKP